MLKVLDLFSGIGGFSLGLESTKGFKTIGFVEKDQFCQKVLKKNFKNIPIIGDIRDVKGSEFKADVITGGFPCQSISIAGKQKGKDDDRFLFPEMLRVIKEVKPRWIIGENVQNLINISNGTILREIIEGLETEGFEVQCFSISASSQGAWHKRERIWIIATNTKSFRPRERRDFNKEEGLEKSKSTQLNSICSDVSDSNSRMRRRRGTIGESRENEIWGFHSEKEEQPKQNFRSKTVGCNAIPGETKNLQHTNDQRLQEFNFSEKSNKQNFNNREFIKGEKNKSWWETESRICGVPDGVSYGMDKDRANRIKALGNSIVPQIARELGLAILDAEQN